LFCACGSPTSGVVAHPTPTISLPPISPAPVASAPGCNLPIYWSTTITSNTIHAGFYHYPEGDVQGNTSVTEIAASQSFFESTATYDRPVNRWLPVAANAVSPDGLRFAFADYDLSSGPGNAVVAGGVIATTGKVHIVDARTGAGQVVFSGSPTFSVVAFTSGGLYLSQVALTKIGPVAGGLFVLNLAGGTPRPVVGANRTLDQNGWQIDGSYAWGVDFASGGGHISGNRVLRLDLKTGKVQEWKTWAEGVLTLVLGLDAQDDPIVGAVPAYSINVGSMAGLKGLQVWTFTSPDIGTLVYQSNDPAATLPSGPAFSDGHVAWLGGNSPPSSVWRLAPGAAMTRVPVSVADSGWVSIGGPCL
jgi:hypothetical protein